ncbi:MAG: hypothetical protein F6K35_03765 [Okeania sp. SIO2H7]|nr:hypothetical protein [Okeania sp. SIO2H7]
MIESSYLNKDNDRFCSHHLHWLAVAVETAQKILKRSKYLTQKTNNEADKNS